MSLRIHCAPNATTVSRQPQPRPLGSSGDANNTLDVVFDVVEDYTHMRYWWKASSGFAFAPGAATCGDDGSGCAMPLFLNTTFWVPPEEVHVGEATARVQRDQ